MSTDEGRVSRDGTTAGPGYVDAAQIASPFTRLGLRHGHRYFRQLRRNLRYRLLFAYVTPLFLLASYFLYQYNETLREGIDTHLKSIAENQRNTVDLYLQERTANLRGTLRSIEQFDPLPAGAMRAKLELLQTDSLAFVDVGLFDREGTLLSYAGPYENLQGRDYSAESWFKRVLAAEDRTFISDVYMGFRNEPHFIIAVTRNVVGRPWILRASLDTGEFSKFVGRSHLIVEADAFIVNRHGQPQTFFTSPTTEQTVPEGLLGRADTSVEQVEMEGTTFLAALAALQKSDWWLVVRVPEDQAYAPLRRAQAGIGAIMLATLIVVVAVALRSTKSLVGRLERADTAREDLQRQLFNAAKLASVGEMAAGVAHEINNPLAVIYEEAGIMLDTLNPEFQRQPDMDEFEQRLTAIGEASIRGRNITRQLLAFARKDEPSPVDLDINDLVRHCLFVKRTEFAVSNIEVHTDLADDLPPVPADHTQMEQVLLNLLNNARDAISGAGRISVETRPTGRAVQIRVSDDGCGMSQDLMERVFFPFFTTKGVGKGTGLGLSISYGIVKGLGGNIEVESELGKGTTFIITLPVARASKRSKVLPTARGNDG